MKIRLNLLILALLYSVLSNYAQVKVACVGNSITYGAGIENREQNCYPAQLGRLLGDGWEVKNFGVSGSTLLKKGDRPYWNQKAFENAQAFNPDVVIIKLGTNDTKPQNWKFKEDFVADYSEMIKTFKKLESKPLVFICYPVPAYPERWGISDSTITVGVIPYVKKIARKNHVKIIDLYKPMSNHAEWFPDKIHPNADGAAEMARVINTFLDKYKKKLLKRKRK